MVLYLTSDELDHKKTLANRFSSIRSNTARSNQDQAVLFHYTVILKLIQHNSSATNKMLLDLHVRVEFTIDDRLKPASPRTTSKIRTSWKDCITICLLVVWLVQRHPVMLVLAGVLAPGEVLTLQFRERNHGYLNVMDTWLINLHVYPLSCKSACYLALVSF